MKRKCLIIIAANRTELNQITKKSLGVDLFQSGFSSKGSNPPTHYIDTIAEDDAVLNFIQENEAKILEVITYAGCIDLTEKLDQLNVMRVRY